MTCEFSPAVGRGMGYDIYKVPPPTTRHLYSQSYDLQAGQDQMHFVAIQFGFCSHENQVYYCLQLYIR